MLRSAPKFHEVAKRIVEITEGCILVAHNAEFDYRMLRTEFRRLGYHYKKQTLCTVELARELIPGKDTYKLGKLSRALGIPLSKRHRADGDARATMELFKLLLAKDSSKTIIKNAVKTEVVLNNSLLTILEKLPSKAGIYYIHKNDGSIIYIGKSRSIKSKVNRHFTGTSKIAKTIQKEVVSVSHETTGNELIAALKMYQEIKAIAPEYNTYTYRNTAGKTKDLYSYPHRNMVIVDRGRDVEERSAVLIENNLFMGFGFFNLNHQIKNIRILRSIITPMEHNNEINQIIKSYLLKNKKLKIIAF